MEKQGIEVNIDSVSRLSGLIIEQNPELSEKGKEGYLEAFEKLKTFSLSIVCGDEIKKSKALQAALITAINEGKRAFLGGVYIAIENDVKFLLPWSNGDSLNKIILELGGRIVKENEVECSFSLYFGKKAIDNNSLRIVCNGWQGGVEAFGESINLNPYPDFSLGGILAGSLGVGLAFLKVTKEKIDACIKSIGLSLWNLNLNWLDPLANGPEISYLPQKYWLVGLGHLGQAYTWTLGLLPFQKPSEISVTLQDTDKVSIANFETGLLTETKKIGIKKTRVCSEWLEGRGINTSIIDRNFDDSHVPQNIEPLILICGLDSAKARRSIDISKFKFVIDCGIGGTRTDFDSISIYNFPEIGKSVKEIWSDEEAKIINKNNEKAMEFIGCGFYGKAISTSFVGGLASTLVFAELIRAGYQGLKTGSINISIRNILDDTFISGKSSYYTELSDNGFK